ncbi:MAG: ribosome maturation factor RimP [Pseudomonadales bacterium]|nr:ribosome maturation factor RimP [Pseudomonadales bacterium]
MAASTAQIQELIAPIVIDLGFEFWGLEYQTQSGAALLRVFIESPNGISVDDCAKVSREVSLLLDVEDPIRSEYRLEVSSPGMSRPFFTLDQYSRYSGFFVKIKLRFAFEGRRQFKGLLAGVENDEVLIRDGEDEYSLPFEAIDKGSMIPQFE